MFEKAIRRLSQNRRPDSSRPRRTGLGTACAVSIGVLLIWRAGAGGPASRPVILPSPVISSAPSPEPAAPVSILLRSPLKLTPGQARQLHGIMADEVKAEQPLLAKIGTDRGRFELFIRKAQSTAGASLQTLQSEAAPISADSTELAHLRRAYWNRALSFLTAPQRSQAAGLPATWLQSDSDRREPQ